MVAKMEKVRVDEMEYKLVARMALTVQRKVLLKAENWETLTGLRKATLMEYEKVAKKEKRMVVMMVALMAALSERR